MILCFLVQVFTKSFQKSKQVFKILELLAWAAITLCLSSTSRQPGQRQSRQRHNRLCPFKHEITPWFRHRAHFGVRSAFRPPSTSSLITSTHNFKTLKTIHKSSHCNVFSGIDGCKDGFKFKTRGRRARPAFPRSPLVEPSGRELYAAFASIFFLSLIHLFAKCSFCN